MLIRKNKALSDLTVLFHLITNTVKKCPIIRQIKAINTERVGRGVPEILFRGPALLSEPNS
jgi:hypothetical protein